MYDSLCEAPFTPFTMHVYGYELPSSVLTPYLCRSSVPSSSGSISTRSSLFKDISNGANIEQVCADPTLLSDKTLAARLSVLMPNLRTLAQHPLVTGWRNKSLTQVSVIKASHLCA
jgi:hypothetical protein